MPNVMYDNTWRCCCSKENRPTDIWCVACDKRRWKHLGWTHFKVLDVLSMILPANVFEGIQS